jgi:hypothetical protein
MSNREKILHTMSKKLSAGPVNEKSEEKTSVIDPLKDQYEVIRQDVLRLRDDLSKGYDLIKETFEKKGIISELLKAR